MAERDDARDLVVRCAAAVRAREGDLADAHAAVGVAVFAMLSQLGTDRRPLWSDGAVAAALNAPSPSAGGTDRAWMSALLAHVLAQHPAQMSEAELRAAMGASPGQPDSMRAHRRALDELVIGGLLHHTGDRVAPAAVALLFDGLDL